MARVTPAGGAPATRRTTLTQKELLDSFVDAGLIQDGSEKHDIEWMITTSSNEIIKAPLSAFNGKTLQQVMPQDTDWKKIEDLFRQNLISDAMALILSNVGTIVDRQAANLKSRLSPETLEKMYSVDQAEIAPAAAASPAAETPRTPNPPAVAVVAGPAAGPQRAPIPPAVAVAVGPLSPGAPSPARERATPEVIISLRDLSQSFLDAGLLEERPSGQSRGHWFAREGFFIVTKEGTTWQKFISTALPVFNGKSLQELIPKLERESIKASFDSNQIGGMGMLILSDLGTIIPMVDSEGRSIDQLYRLSSKTLAKMYPEGIPVGPAGIAPAAAAVAAGPAAAPPRAPSPPEVAVASGPAVLAPRVPSPVMARATQITITQEELLQSFLDAGLLEETASAQDPQGLLNTKFKPGRFLVPKEGRTWKEFISTPLPVFNNKTLKEVMGQNPELGEIQKYFDHKAILMLTNVILLETGTSELDSSGILTGRYRLSPETLGRMYEDQAGIAPEAAAAVPAVGASPAAAPPRAPSPPEVPVASGPAAAGPGAASREGAVAEAQAAARAGLAWRASFPVLPPRVSSPVAAGPASPGAPSPVMAPATPAAGAPATRRTTITQEELLQSFIDVGLIQNTAEFGLVNIMQLGRTWKEFITTPLPVFDGKTLEQVIQPRSDLERIRALFDDRDAYAPTPMNTKMIGILRRVGAVQFDENGIPTGKYRLSAETLGRIYGDQAGIASAAAAVAAGPAAEPPRAPSPPAAPARDEITELSQQIQRIKAGPDLSESENRNRASKLKEIYNLQFRGKRVGDILRDPSKLSFIKWIQNPSDNGSIVEHELRQDLEGPYAREALAAPPQSEADRLFDQMEIIRLLPEAAGYDKNQELLLLQFEGKSLGQILGPDFDFGPWLREQANRTAQMALQLKESLNMYADRKDSPSAGVTLKAQLEALLKSYAQLQAGEAALSGDAIDDLFRKMHRIKVSGSATPIDDISSLRYKGRRLGDILDSSDINSFLQAPTGPDERIIQRRFRSSFEAGNFGPSAVSSSTGALRNELKDRLSELPIGGRVNKLLHMHLDSLGGFSLIDMGITSRDVSNWLKGRPAADAIADMEGLVALVFAAAARGGAPARAESPGGESPGRGRRSPSPEGGLGASSPRAGGAAAGGSAGRPGFNRGAFKQELADFLAELGRQSGRVNAIRDHRFGALGNRTPLQVGITGTDINNWLQQRPAAIAIPDLDSFVDQVAEVAARGGTPAREESSGRGRRSPSADGGHGAWSPRAGGAAAGGSAGRSDFNREAFRREFAEFLRSLGPGGGRVSKIEKNKFATLGNRSPEDVGINGTQIDAWLRQRRTEDAIADLDSFVDQVAEVAARGTPARAPSPGAVRRPPSPVGAGHRAPSPGPAAEPPRAPITPAAPERDDITELLLNMSMIKRTPGGTIEDLRRLQFRGHTLADALFGKPFDLQRWMDADPARQLPIEERLRRLLSSPAVAAGPARAPSPGAARADLPVPHTPAVDQEQKPGWGRRAWGWISGR